MTSVLISPKIADSVLDLIGRTPMVRLGKVGKEANVLANIVLKLESMEAASSVKDRLAKALIEGAEQRGEITPGETVLVEPTSGNTGVGMAMVAAAKGYQLVLTMPDSTSIERRVMIKALGARLVLTPGAKGMKGSIAKAQEIVDSLEGKGRILGQFDNPDNVAMHRATTGPEIWEQTSGEVDVFVAGVGTGGTISGVAQFLRSVKPSVRVVAVEPKESAVLSGGAPGPHKIQGIGAGFIPANCHVHLFDEILQVSSEEAIATARRLAVAEGLFVGISAGAAVAAAIQVGRRPEFAGKTIAVIIPSFGERYLSTVLFADLMQESKDQVAEAVGEALPTPASSSAAQGGAEKEEKS